MKKLRKNTAAEDAAINAGIKADPDAFEATPEQMKTARRGRPPLLETERKTRITILLDPGIVGHFKADGRGWQTRINEVLANHVDKAGRRKRA